MSGGAVAAATFAVIVAALLDWKPPFKAWICDRVAAVLALFAASVFIAGTPAAAWLLQQGEALAAWLGDIVRQWSPSLGSAVASYLIAAVVLVIAWLWVLAMLPSSKFASFLGDGRSKELDSRLIWGGAALLAVGAALVPGGAGDLIRWLVGLGVTAGGKLADLAI